MDEDAVERTHVGKRLRRAWRATRLWIIFIIGMLGTALALSLPQLEGETSFVLEVHDVAPQDILAPYALSYSSEVLTQAAQQAAAEQIPDIYDPPDSNVARQQLERLNATLSYIDNVRADTNASEEQQLADMMATAEVRLNAASAQAILDLPSPRWEAVKLEAASVLEQVLRSEIREGREEEARRTIPALVSISLPENQVVLASELASAFVAYNAKLNQEVTESAREQARQATGPVQKSYAPGETIISRGEIVSPLEIEALSIFGLLKPPGRWQGIAIRSVFILVLGCTVTLFAYRTNLDLTRDVRLAATVSILFIVIAVGMQLMIPGRAVLPYLFPAALLPMLLTVLLTPGMGVITAMALGAIAGFLGARGLELALYYMFSGAIAALVIGRAERLSSFFWAGLAAAASAATIVAIFRFPDPATDILGKAMLTGGTILSGFLSASLSFGLILLIGNMLGITTSLQLIELSRPDHPLLQLILQNAPGTYQHSLQVANLAEQAARAIGANSLLTRVGALYHDAGKALRPQFFIENQVEGQNVHEQLDPTTSASVILGHIQDGKDLARKYRIPQSIQDFINEHHGTMVTRYQYSNALNAANGDANLVDRQEFAYAGPRPRSRETAILMLADGVEAKARADKPPDVEALDALARWVIEDRLSKGQLDRTDLTLKDLDTIRRSFVKTLKNVYHPRIKYPEVEEQTPQVSQSDTSSPSLPPADS
jgi:putative nucleotidyltransferase with HDIG domain